MTIEAVRQLRASALSPVTHDHPFEAGGALGDQCRVIGCWGWVDDPRHHRFSRRARVVVPLKLKRDRSHG